MQNEIKPDGTFVEWDKPCPQCGNTDIFRYKRVNQHIGAYCAFCDDLWLGWVKQWTDKDWDRYIKERDFYICQRCGKLLQGRDAQAHHKIPKWFIPKLRYDLNNGICLCRACHKQIHGKGGTIKESEDKEYETNYQH